MSGYLLTVLISGALSVLAALVTVVLTHYFGRKRDREADWRKMKLEHYKEYVAALSGTVHHPMDSTVQRRHSDAVNSLTLVAPTKVLTAPKSHAKKESARKIACGHSAFTSDFCCRLLQREFQNYRGSRRDCQRKRRLLGCDRLPLAIPFSVGRDGAIA